MEEKSIMIGKFSESTVICQSTQTEMNPKVTISPQITIMILTDDKHSDAHLPKDYGT